jgi:hypothetical protein
MIIIRTKNEELGRKSWKFNTRNINRIAFDYAARIISRYNDYAVLLTDLGQSGWVWDAQEWEWRNN